MTVCYLKWYLAQWLVHTYATQECDAQITEINYTEGYNRRLQKANECGMMPKLLHEFDTFFYYVETVEDNRN